MKRAWSLRGRLVTLLTLFALAGWATSSYWLYRTALVESGRLFDAAMIETAYSLLSVLAHELGSDEADEEEPEVELKTLDHAHDESLYFHVRRIDGTVLFRSPGSPRKALAPAHSAGMANRRVGDASYRVYTLESPDDGIAIDVAQPAADRMRIARGAAVRLMIPGIALALLLAVGVWVIVRRVTAPLVRYSAAIDQRAPGDASVVPYDGLPRELAPMTRAIDGLLHRVESALLHERTLTADAAHELRTPLAALRAQAQVALRARDDEERRQALLALMTGVDRAARMVDGVLSLARLDAQQLDRARLQPVDLARLILMVIDERRGELERRGLQVQTRLAAISDRVDADAFALLLRNLLDNAIRHARLQIEIVLELIDNQSVLRVHDDGPGMPPEQAARAFDRFFRASPGSGAGLGLALVRRVAELHGGSATLGSGLNSSGLGVSAHWPRLQPSA